MEYKVQTLPHVIEVMGLEPNLENSKICDMFAALQKHPVCVLWCDDSHCLIAFTDAHYGNIK